MMEVITLDDTEPNEEEDEELLLHDIDEDVGEEVEAGDDFKTLQISMEKEIEDLMDKLEKKLINRKPITKLINPITRRAEQPLPQVRNI